MTALHVDLQRPTCLAEAWDAGRPKADLQTVEFAPLLWSCSDALGRLQIGFGKVGVDADLRGLGNSGARGVPRINGIVEYEEKYLSALIQ